MKGSLTTASHQSIYQTVVLQTRKVTAPVGWVTANSWHGLVSKLAPPTFYDGKLLVCSNTGKLTSSIEYYWWTFQPVYLAWMARWADNWGITEWVHPVVYLILPGKLRYYLVLPIGNTDFRVIPWQGTNPISRPRLTLLISQGVTNQERSFVTGW